MEIKNNEKMQNNQNLTKNNAKNKQKSKKISEKSKYFDFYDDIKIGSTKNVDW